MPNSTTIAPAVKTVNRQVQVASSYHVAEFKTTKCLKVLRFLFPSEEWSADKLHKKVRASNNGYSLPNACIHYSGQPSGLGTEHLWKVSVSHLLMQKFMEADRQAEDEIILQSQTYPKLWNGLTLRSPAEEMVAEALQRKGVLFFGNAKSRLFNKTSKVYETLETDFLVMHKGKLRVLEVDGQNYHQNFGSDYKRDRTFAREGIETSRFTGNECLSNPNAVVEEFLGLF